MINAVKKQSSLTETERRAPDQENVRHIHVSFPSALIEIYAFLALMINVKIDEEEEMQSLDHMCCVYLCRPAQIWKGSFKLHCTYTTSIV